MRLYLLPISTRRTLLYCQRLNTPATTTNQTWMDKIQTKAAKTWADWEKKDKGWQKQVVSYGNYAFRRIPYEEWGLKSVPPLRRDTELEGSEKAEVVYPQSLITGDRVPQILKRLATEREGLHKRRLIWCFIGMPISAPIALIPLYAIPFLRPPLFLYPSLTSAEYLTSPSSTSSIGPGRTGGRWRAAGTSSSSSRITS
jgi:hypothetical protein